MNRLAKGVKSCSIRVLKAGIYSMLYLRIALLKTRHFILYKRQSALSSLYSAIKQSAMDAKPKKAIFEWGSSNAVLRSRVNIVTIGFALVFLIISVRLLIVATSEYVNYRKANERTNAHRLDITDRNNNLLAVNLPGASLYANPRRVFEPKSAVKKLLTVIPDLDAKKILKKLQDNIKSFVWIKRDLTPQEHEKIYNLGMPGFSFEREQKRIYTYGNLLAHVIGYVGRDLKGLAGLEKYFDKFLTGQKETEDRSEFGNNLQLSIDVRVQNILSEEIEKNIKKFSAKGGAGIVVDPSNGEIIALVSKPDFDPHHPGSAKPNQRFNMATQGVYEMGSGMKGLTIAVGIDTASTSITDAYDLTYMKVSGKVLKDSHPMKGWYSVPYIFLKSSNIGVAQIMLEIGRDDLQKYLRKLGLLDRLNIELPERGRPLFPAFSRWTDLSLVTMSYGYALSESPLHFIQAMMPIVNGGISYPVTLLKQKNGKQPEGERIFKESTSIAMRKLMRLVVTDGTGSKARVKGYYVGGKTGTAEVAHAGKYDKNRRVSSFFGIIPAYDPKYMVYTVYNEPKGIKETYGWAGGGWVGAPSVGAVFKRMASLYGMEKIEEDDPRVVELNNIEYKIKNET